MRNADEHKKLLAQIAELEKNSVNYFDVEKEFFIIDSNNLSEIKTRLYGYSIQATGIYEDDNLTPEAIANLDGRGCYVYVGVRDGKITIKQDLNGCWGIYLFRHGDYFAVSNSFFRLLDHVKYRYPLTVNRDYCHYLMINGVCSQAYSETAINEIQLVDRSAILKMEITSKTLQIELIDYKEYTIPLDSEEGIATLDRWVDLWGNIFRSLSQHTKFIQADLSGGFDTRVSFLFLLNSGIDISKMIISSNKSSLHCFPEDYEIASNIAKHYDFKLNKPLPQRQFLNYSLFNAWNIDLYHQQTFRNLSTIAQFKKSVNKLYYLKGLSGETIRGYWRSLPKNFLKNQSRKTDFYSHHLSNEIFSSMKVILKSGFNSIINKYNIGDDNSDIITQLLYQETRARNHYGKETLGHFFKNTIILSPALDPEIRTLQLDTQECKDSKLMLALLFTRYEPDLLTFPFEGKRSIAPETIAYTQKINERFPRRVTTDKLSGGGASISFTAA